MRMACLLKEKLTVKTKANHWGFPHWERQREFLHLVNLIKFLLTVNLMG
jgi:hypothetical protein